METIRCENCGEDYSVTYKRCPFCEDEDYERPAVRRKSGGGKRLASNTKSGGYGRPRSQFMRIFALLLSLVLIVAAICIVLSIIRTIFHIGGPESDSPGTPTEQADPSGPAGSDLPPGTTTPDPSDTPGTVEDPQGSDPAPSLPEVTLATDFSLSSSDITLFYSGEKAQLKATMIPAGTSGAVSWKSSNPAVATVSDTGLVTAVSVGTAKVIATMGDVSKTCIVRCNFKTTSTTPAAPETPAETMTLNRSDFTLLYKGETFTLQASGVSGKVTWSIGNTAVATIDQNGTVTAVGNGFTTVTATAASGAKATCIVRVAIS